MENYVEHLKQQIKAGKEANFSQDSFNEFKKVFSEKNNVYKLAAQRAILAVAHPFLNLHYDIVLNKNQYPLV